MCVCARMRYTKTTRGENRAYRLSHARDLGQLCFGVSICGGLLVCIHLRPNRKPSEAAIQPSSTPLHLILSRILKGERVSGKKAVRCSSVRVAVYCFFNRWKCFRVREGCCNTNHTLHQNQPHFPVHASVLSLTVPRISPQQGSLFPPFKCNATFSFQIETIPGELNPCGGYGVFHPTCACVCASAYASSA